jgi:MarR family transcriptional regulator, organic hydroperoxide resistance regulator
MSDSRTDDSRQDIEAFRLAAARRIREFNRFYMPPMTALGNRYFGSEYSATEARVFFEIYGSEGCTATYIMNRVNIGKSCLGRIINKNEKKGLLRRETSEEDGRFYHIFLTEKGIEVTEYLILRSNEEISGMLEGASDEDVKKLVGALDTVTDVMRKGMGL